MRGHVERSRNISRDNTEEKDKQRREKMNKFTILSPLVLLATTALAQDSTCILQPSCSQLGYTSAEADCGNQKVLRCPFDVSQVACVGGSSGTSGGGGDYNPNDPNDELGDAIVLVIDKTATGDIAFTYGGGNIYVDCGNGIIVGGSASSSGTISCSYSELGKYTVKLSGSFTYYGGASGTPTTLLKLDKSGITKMSKVCGSTTKGVVPPLPSTLKDATQMFFCCNNINSPYPKLPDGLELADFMFASGNSTSTPAINFSGSVELPSSLKSAKGMFNGNVNLQTVTGLENTQITNGNCMFNKTNLTSLPLLPEGLQSAKCMFMSTSSMVGILTSLPSSLTNAFAMFKDCSGLTGSFSKPNNLSETKYMFSGTSFTIDSSWPEDAKASVGLNSSCN